nr:hypothetical protein [Tanacetum cinerariifolium]
LAFFKKGWDVVGNDVCRVVWDFFDNGKLLKEVNHTFLTLIPKVDIQKSYDTVDWPFLAFILKRFGFHPTMVKWIMACVTSPSFSICINGYNHGYFKGKRGLRQGDPLSPYLFTLVMEILTLILQRRVHSAKVVMESLDEFKQVSGLVPSIPKSTVYFCNVANHVKLAILNIMPFAEGTLLVQYLGVPLISSRLFNRDCKILVEKTRNRSGDWKNKSLSFAGRLQLCKSMISSMQVYWASVLVIPIGGLGLRCLEVFNLALMTTHIWHIVSNKESLWVRDIAREGYTLQTHVADLVVNGAWNWPLTWLAKAPILSTLSVPMLTEHEDSVYWRDSNGLMSTFSVKCAWEALRPYGLEVWSLVRVLAGMESVPPRLEDIVNWLRPMVAKRTFKSVVGKLLFASTTYFVRCERNNRLFKNIRRSPEELKDQIMDFYGSVLISSSITSSSTTKMTCSGIYGL